MGRSHAIVRITAGKEFDRPMRLSDADLVSSPVVANCDMNRRRGSRGVNSYQRELKLDPIEWISERLQTCKSISWLDLCCGEANALVEAAVPLPADAVAMTGIDLVDFFNPRAAAYSNIRLLVAPLLEAKLDEQFDLITCVHGMHYVGDKLAALFKFSAMLKPEGMLIANVDTRDFFGPDGRTVSRRLNKMLRTSGCEYDAGKKIIRTTPDAVPFGYKYLGADDRLGPNYTKQNTVASYYDLTQD